jgi:DNA primase
MHADRTDEPGALRRIRQFVENRPTAYPSRQIDAATFRALTDVHARAAKFYAEQLKASAEAIGYLQRRGVTDEAALYWKLGFAPHSWHGIRDALKEYPIELLVDAGLVIQREGAGHYDRFRGRLTFPIRGSSGDTIAFGGRALVQDGPKYLNSPESLIFRKGQMLYGQYESSLVDTSIDRLWVVEGYMDVVTLWQHGVRNCVATLGTSTTTEHVLQLFRMTQELLFCFDGDDAGKSAAWRALERTLPALRRGRRVGFLVLPQGVDPDSLVRKEGIHTLQSLADQAQSLPVFLARELAALYDTSYVEGRARYLARAAALLARVTDRDWRFELSTEVAERAHVTAGMVECLADGEKPTRSRATRPRCRNFPP